MKRALAISHVMAWKEQLLIQRLQILGYTVDHICTRQGDALPSSARGYDAILSGGGFESVSRRATLPWMSTEIALIEDALSRGTPFLGLCLGAQLLAAALGEVSAPSPTGIQERGYCPIRPQHDCMIGPSHVFQWHSEGFALPRGAELLASSEHFAVQGFRMNGAVGLQFHPDVDANNMTTWIAAVPASQTMGTGFAQDQSLLGKHYDPMILDWLDVFLPWWLGGHGAS